MFSNQFVHVLLVEHSTCFARALIGDDIEAEVALSFAADCTIRRLVLSVSASSSCPGGSRGEPVTVFLYRVISHGLEARLLARFVHVRVHALEERSRPKPTSVKPRRPASRSVASPALIVEFELSLRQPVHTVQASALSGDARAAVIGREARERRLQGEANELLLRITLIDPGVA